MPAPEEQTDLAVRFGLCGHTCDPEAVQRVSYYEGNCPVCGRHHASLAEPFLTRDLVPSESLGWDGATRSKEDKLKSRAKPDSIKTIEELVADLLSGHTPCWDLQGELLQSTLPVETEGNNSFLVWRAKTTGCTIKKGAMRLPPGSVLLLEGFGVHFQDITFSGGTVICAGDKWSGSFHGCNFHCSRLYVVHGASLTLRNSAFLNCAVACVASGGGASVHAIDSSFRECFTSVIAERTASVTLDSCVIRDTITAVIANGAGAHACVRGTKLRGAAVRPPWSCGVAVHGGTAELHACVISRFHAAVMATGAGAHVEVHGGRAASCEFGVQLFVDAIGALRDTEVIVAVDKTFQRGQACGVLLGEGEGADEFPKASGATVQMDHCTVHGRGPHVAGVSMVSRCRAAIDDCSIRGAEMSAVSLGWGVNTAVVRRCDLKSDHMTCRVSQPQNLLWLEGCNASSTGPAGTAAAAVALKGARLVIVDTQIVGQVDGFYEGMVSVFDESSAALLRCDLSGGGLGMLVRASRVRIRDCRIADMHAVLPHGYLPDGVGIRTFGGHVEVVGGRLEGCRMGVVLQDWEDKHNQGTGDAGVGATNLTAEQAAAARARRATLLMRGVDVRACGGAVFSDDRGAEVSLTDCECRGGWEEPAGAEDSPGGEGAASDDEDDLPEGAVIVERAQMVTLHRTVMDGIAPCMHVGQSVDATIEDCTFRNMPADTCCVALESKATVKGCRFSVTDECIAVFAPGAVIEGCVFAASRQCVIAHEACNVWECRFVHGVSVGIAAHPGAEVRARGCAFTACTTAVMGKRESSVIAVDCECTDAVVGFSMEEPEAYLSLSRVRVAGGPGMHGVVAGADEAEYATISLVLEQCTFEQVGLVLRKFGASATLANCVARSAEVGFKVEEGARLNAMNCEVVKCRRGVVVGQPGAVEARRQGNGVAADISARPPDAAPDDADEASSPPNVPPVGAKPADAPRGGVPVPAAEAESNGARSTPAAISNVQALEGACAAETRRAADVRLPVVRINDSEIRGCTMEGVRVHPNGACVGRGMRVVHCPVALAAPSVRHRGSYYNTCTAVPMPWVRDHDQLFALELRGAGPGCAVGGDEGGTGEGDWGACDHPPIPEGWSVARK